MLVSAEVKEAPLPTNGLRYCHGKKQVGNTVRVAHFWEIGEPARGRSDFFPLCLSLSLVDSLPSFPAAHTGGGERLLDLVDVVITPERIEDLVVVIVLDLSEVGILSPSFVFLLRDPQSHGTFLDATHPSHLHLGLCLLEFWGRRVLFRLSDTMRDACCHISLR